MDATFVLDLFEICILIKNYHQIFHCIHIVSHNSVYLFYFGIACNSSPLYSLDHILNNFYLRLPPNHEDKIDFEQLEATRSNNAQIPEDAGHKVDLDVVVGSIKNSII